MKSGNPNFLEPSVPLQACNGISLHFTTYVRRGTHFIAEFIWILLHILSIDVTFVKLEAEMYVNLPIKDVIIIKINYNQISK